MADAVSVEALAALESAMASLLPAGVPAGLSRQLSVSARQVRPLGLGGYVGLHSAPDGMLHGRRVAARVAVDVSGGSDAAAQGYAATLAGQILAASRAESAALGIQRIRGADPSGVRNLAFDVDFEYVRVPDAGEGLITTLALESFNNVTPYRTKLRAAFGAASLALLADPLADFAAATDADAAPAGAWSLDAAEPAAIVQTAASAGGPLDLSSPQKAGTLLLWRPGGAPLALERFVASIVFRSTSPDGVGLVFHHQAPDRYDFFLASQRHGYHLFGRRRPGLWQTVASAPFGFTPGATQRLVVGAYDGTLFAELDERRTLLAQTERQPGGEIGLLTHGNTAARFLAGRLMQLQ